MPQVGTSGLRPPVNRKVVLYVLAGICAIVLVAFMLLFAKSNPQAAREKALAAAQQKAVADLPSGTKQQAQTAINQQLRSIAAGGPTGSGTGSPAAPRATAAQSDIPPITPELLKQLERADQESRKPNLGGSGLVTPGLSLQPAAGHGASFGGTTKDPGVFEDYPKATAAAGATGPSGQSTATTYSAVHPLDAPSTAILSEGSWIRLVLINAIDTRNPGSVTAMVTQDVYSSLVPDEVLVPKGSRLIGAYAQKVSPGLPRIPVAFSRLILPDGRAVNLGGMDAVNYAGAAGVPGKYHSNILRALGPSLVTALIGTWIDRQSESRQQREQVTPGGAVMQAPSVAEQLAPQVNQEVMSRYAGAEPYFIVKAGTAFKLQTSRDIVIPVASNVSHGAPQARDAGTDQSYWEAQ